MLDSNQLPPFREGLNYKIELKEGAKPEDLRFSLIYKISNRELKTVYKYIKENLKQGFISPFKEAFTTLTLFTTKANGDLRFYIDF